MLPPFPILALAEVRAHLAAEQAVTWLGEVLRALREVQADYAQVGGSPGEIDWYVRAKVHAVNEMFRRLAVDAREGARAMLQTLAEFEPSTWLEEEYGAETFRMVRRKIDRLRAILIERLTTGASLPPALTVA